MDNESACAWPLTPGVFEGRGSGHGSQSRRPSPLSRRPPLFRIMSQRLPGGVKPQRLPGGVKSRRSVQFKDERNSVQFFDKTLPVDSIRPHTKMTRSGSDVEPIPGIRRLQMAKPGTEGYVLNDDDGPSADRFYLFASEAPFDQVRLERGRAKAGAIYERLRWFHENRDKGVPQNGGMVFFPEKTARPDSRPKSSEPSLHGRLSGREYMWKKKARHNQVAAEARRRQEQKAQLRVAAEARRRQEQKAQPRVAGAVSTQAASEVKPVRTRKRVTSRLVKARAVARKRPASGIPAGSSKKQNVGQNVPESPLMDDPLLDSSTDDSPEDSPSAEVFESTELKVHFAHGYMSIDTRCPKGIWRGMLPFDMRQASVGMIRDIRQLYMSAIRRGDVPDEHCTKEAVCEELGTWYLGSYTDAFEDAIAAAGTGCDSADPSSSESDEYDATGDEEDSSDYSEFDSD